MLASGDPSALLKPAEQAVWDVDKNQPVFDAMPMIKLAAQSVTLRRTSTILLFSFAVSALVLAAIGAVRHDGISPSCSAPMRSDCEWH